MILEPLGMASSKQQHSEISTHSPTLQKAFQSTFHEKYSFSDFLNTDINTETESFLINKRPVYKASVKLKKFSRFLNNFIFNFADVNTNVVHSYSKGKSPYTAVQEHAQSKYFFKTDIKNFFYSIHKSDIKNLLDENCQSVPISDFDKHKKTILNLITIDGLLPVGLPTSPSITNSILFQFDNALETYCSTRKIIYTRYSDDIILSSSDRSSLNGCLDIVSQLLAEYSSIAFTINKHKTKYTHIGNKVKLLGMVVLPSGELSVESNSKKEIEALFHFYTVDKNKFDDILDKKFKNSLPVVSGRLNYISTIDSGFLTKLRKKYGNFIVDYFYEKPEDEA